MGPQPVSAVPEGFRDMIFEERGDGSAYLSVTSRPLQSSPNISAALFDTKSVQHYD